MRNTTLSLLLLISVLGFAKSANPVKKSTIDYYSNKPFNLGINKIPLGYNGVNPVQLFQNLIIRDGESKKSEFETTKQFESRTKNKELSPIIGNVYKDSLFAVSAKLTYYKLSPKYDADNGKMTIDIELDDYVGYKTESKYDRNKKIIELKTIEISHDRYTGSNVYGVKKIIDKYEDEEYSLQINNWESLYNIYKKEIYPTTISFSFEMDSNNAINMTNSIKVNKHKLGCLFIGKLIDPFMSIGYYYSGKATIDDTNEFTTTYHYLHMFIDEIWLYNKTTGKIYSKIKKQDKW